MLTAALLAAAVTAAAGVTAPGIAGAASTPADEAVFLSKINALRGSQGLAPLSVDPALAATSCTWNDQLIVANALSHDPNLSAAIASVEPNWRKGGENVGMGGTLDSLFDAFVASPGHYKNLVDPDYSRVGICSARSATGKLFTTHRFLGVGSSPAPPPPPPPDHPGATAAPAADHPGATAADAGPDCSADDAGSRPRHLRRLRPRRPHPRQRRPPRQPASDSGPDHTSLRHAARRPPHDPHPAALDCRDRVGGPRDGAVGLGESRPHRSVRRACPGHGDPRGVPRLPAPSPAVGERQTETVDSDRGSVEAAIVTDGLTRSFNGQIALDGLDPRRAAGRGARRPRTERRGQDDHRPSAQRRARAGPRLEPVLGLDPARDGNEVRRRTGVLTENAGLDDRLTAWENLVVTGPHPRHEHRLRRATRQPPCSSASGWPSRAAPIACRASRPASASVSRSHGRCCTTPTSSSSTSRRRASTPRRPATSSTSSARSRPSTAARWCSAPTSSARPDVSRDRMAVLDQGRLLAFGTPDELAGSIWQGLDVELDLGAAADDMLIATLAGVEGRARRARHGLGAHLTCHRPLRAPAGRRVVDVTRDPRLRRGPDAARRSRTCTSPS